MINGELVANLRTHLGRIARVLSTPLQSALRLRARHRVGSAEIDIRPLSKAQLATVQSALPESGITSQDLTDHITNRTTIVVAWLDHVPIGIGWIDWKGPRSATVETLLGRVAEIHRLHVHKQYRSLGVGTQLIKSFERLAVLQNQTLIGLGVHMTNHRALTLYRRLGYVEAGGRYLDEYTVRRADGIQSPVRVPALYMVRKAAGAE